MPLLLPTVDQVFAEKTVWDKETPSYSFMTWIPYPSISNEDSWLAIDQMIGKYVKENSLAEASFFYKIGELWKKRIGQFFPTYVTRTLILTFEKEQVNIIPCRYNCNKTGIHDQKDGWKHLLENIQHEPTIRVIQLNAESAELYEIVQGRCTLLINQKIGLKKRWQQTQQFANSIWHICKDQKGPLITRTVDDGIHLLDINTINSIYPVHGSLVYQKNRNIHEWCRNMMQSGLLNQWINEWDETKIEEAKQSQKWVTNEEEWITYLQRDRIKSVVLNESNIQIFNNNHECISLIFRNNIKIVRSSQNITGFIKK